MTFLSNALLSWGAFLIIRYDIKDQAIPLWALVLFAVAGLLRQWETPNLEGWVAAGIIAALMLLCQSLFYALTDRPAVGSGDLVLAPVCGLWLHLDEIPSFLILTGLCALGIGLTWHYRWKMKTFPMAPAILFGLGIILSYTAIF